MSENKENLTSEIKPEETKQELRPLTREELEKFVSKPEVQIGIRMAWDTILRVLAQENIPFAKGAQIYFDSYKLKHDTHDFHTKDESGQGQESTNDTQSTEAPSVPTEQGVSEGDSTTQSK